jgi:AcrR family transcriptional regulator
MENCSSSDARVVVPPWEVQGVTEVRQRTIAAMIARGFSVKQVAKKLKMSESRIYHLLSDRDSTVNAEINRISNELFAASDRRLINLYDKALQKLENMLSSSDEEKQFRAIDRIIRIFFARSGRNAVTIKQYFGIESQEEKQGKRETLDEMIIRMRRARGLPDFPEEQDL